MRSTISKTILSWLAPVSFLPPSFALQSQVSFPPHSPLVQCNYMRYQRRTVSLGQVVNSEDIQPDSLHRLNSAEGIAVAVIIVVSKFSFEL